MFNVQGSRFGVQRSTFNVQRLAFGVWRSTASNSRWGFALGARCLASLLGPTRNPTLESLNKNSLEDCIISEHIAPNAKRQTPNVERQTKILQLGQAQVVLAEVPSSN
jgi:hypothetical protein